GGLAGAVVTATGTGDFDVRTSLALSPAATSNARPAIAVHAILVTVNMCIMCVTPLARARLVAEAPAVPAASALVAMAVARWADDSGGNAKAWRATGAAESIPWAAKNWRNLTRARRRRFLAVTGGTLVTRAMSATEKSWP